MKKNYFTILLVLVCSFYCVSAMANEGGEGLFINPPTVTGNTSLCGSGSTTLTAFATGSGNTYEWYTATTKSYAICHS